MTIEGSLLPSIPIVKGLFDTKFSVPSKIAQKFAVFFFGGEMGRNVKFCFRDPPKGTSLRETTSFDVFIVKIGAGVLAAGWRKNQK